MTVNLSPVMTPFPKAQVSFGHAFDAGVHTKKPPTDSPPSFDDEDDKVEISNKTDGQKTSVVLSESQFNQLLNAITAAVKASISEALQGKQSASDL